MAETAQEPADREIRALHIITKVLAELEPATCDRVLKWARERFVDAPKALAIDTWVDTLMGQIHALQARAKDLGVDDRTLMHAVAHVRSQKRLAPVEDDQTVDQTERSIIERIGQRS